MEIEIIKERLKQCPLCGEFRSFTEVKGLLYVTCPGDGSHPHGSLASIILTPVKIPIEFPENTDERD